MKRYPLTIEGHRVVGAGLHQLRNHLPHLTSAIHNRYPKASEVVRRAAEAQQALDRLRCAMVDQAHRDLRGQADPDDIFRLYFRVPGPPLPVPPELVHLAGVTPRPCSAPAGVPAYPAE